MTKLADDEQLFWVAESKKKQQQKKIVKAVEGSQDSMWQMIGKLIVKITLAGIGKIYSFYKMKFKNCYN